MYGMMHSWYDIITFLIVKTRLSRVDHQFVSLKRFVTISSSQQQAVGLIASRFRIISLRQ